MLSFVAADRNGADWAFDVSGTFTTNQSGLRRADTLWKSLGKAAVLNESRASDEGVGMPLVLLTTDAPANVSSCHQALRVLRGEDRPVFDVVELLDPDGHARLRSYAENGL